MKTFDQMVAEDKKFAPLRDDFFKNVCKTGLWERIDEVSERGMSASFGSIELRTYVIAGRTMITIEENDQQITFITDDKERQSIGLHTTSGDHKAIVLMVWALIESWPRTANEQRSVFKVNSNIQIG